MAPARFLPLLLLFAASLGGCAALDRRAGAAPRASVSAEPSEPWRQAATPADERLLDGLASRWLALTGMAPRGRGASLLDPASAQPRAAPPPGAYLCRFVPLALPPAPGRRGGFCFVGVEGERLSLTVEAGPERLGGYLFEGRGDTRLVFLGTAASRGGRLRGYGADPAADVAGVVERIGPFRWRLAVPSRDGRGIGLYELVPAPVQ